jgi:hypothetical protein
MRICTIAEQYLQTADEFTLKIPPLFSTSGGRFQALYPGSIFHVVCRRNLFRALLAEIIN